MMKRVFSTIICLLCFALFAMQTAFAEQVTLSELRQQTPERLQMSVTTKDGKTIEVDAPIVLPEGDTLPIVLVQSATFDLTDLHTVYPLPKHITGTGREASLSDDRPGAMALPLNLEEKPDILAGKWGATTRASLPQGETPPENNVTVDEIMAFIYENIERFDCDTAPDIRVLNATAKSGLYRIKAVKGENRWPDYIIDETKPVKSASKAHSKKASLNATASRNFDAAHREQVKKFETTMHRHLQEQDERITAALTGTTKVLSKNVDDMAMGWTFNSMMEGYLMNLKTTTGAYLYRDEMNSGKLLGFKYLVSNQIDTVDNKTDMLFGNWADLLIGEQLGLETYTTLDGTWTDQDGVQRSAFDENLSATRALMYVDIAARHAESFAYIKSAKIA